METNEQNVLHGYIDELVEVTFDAEEVGDDYKDCACIVTLNALTAFTISRITGGTNVRIIQATWRASTFEELRDELHKIGGANEETTF